MPFQRFEVHKNYDLLLCRPKPRNSGFEQDKNEQKSEMKYFPKTYYKYNNKFYVQDKSVLEYNHSIVYKKLICTDNELDTVIFYDKKTFDTSVERIKSYRKPSNISKTNSKVQRTSKKAFVVKQERTLSDNDIEMMFETC